VHEQCLESVQSEHKKQEHKLIRFTQLQLVLKCVNVMTCNFSLIIFDSLLFGCRV